MSILSSKRNQIIAAVVLALVLVLAYLNFVAPLKTEQADKERLLVQKQKELEALKKRTDGGGTLGAEEQVSLSRTRSRIPEVPDVEGLLRDVRMLEVVSKMPLASYNFEIGKAQEQSGQGGAQANAAKTGEAGTATLAAQSLVIPIKLNTTAKGDYGQIHRFLEELQSSQRLMQVEKLSFTAKATAPVKVNAPKKEITVNVTLVSYYAPGLQKFFKTPVPVNYSKPEGKLNPIY
ncbi:hypothetical protein [Paenibacillus sp. HJGM_3]|uniref:hypothetical protein n=1 Tax=Paenibacillus sp. HJGM_3 TaxID=3379816 RepID=UPI0038682982